MHDSKALHCCYCNTIIAADDDAQRVSKREVAHTACAFRINDKFFAALDAEAESEQDDDAN